MTVTVLCLKLKSLIPVNIEDFFEGQLTYLEATIKCQQVIATLFYVVWIAEMYSLPNIVGVVKLRRMRWAGHVAHMGEDRGVHRVLVGKPEGKRPLGRPRRSGRIILRWIFRKLEGVVGTGWSWLRIGTDGGHLWVW